MDENILRFRVGIFVVIAMLILAILVFLNGGVWTSQYTILTKAKSAPGVKRGTPIRKHGILIGRVEDTEFTGEEEYPVKLILGIYSGAKIYSNEFASIGTESLLGDAGIEIVKKSNEKGEPLPRGELLPREMASGEIDDAELLMVVVKQNPLDIVEDLKPQLKETLAAIEYSSLVVADAGIGMREVSATVKNAFAEDGKLSALIDDFSETSAVAKDSLENFRQFSENVYSLVDDDNLKYKINGGIAYFSDVLDSMKFLVEDTRGIVKEFKEVPEGVTANLENIELFTSMLKDRGPEILNNTDKFIADIKKFTDSIPNNGEGGTIGKLLNDQEMYDEAISTVKKLREVSTKIEPMINDLRMFADAIARDPGVIGIRGALDRRPSKTGAKENTAGRDGGFFRAKR
ncbi:MAG: MlaD family protein [Mariniblastus sp.]|nr:MlaD family protein [Mariniblastus sp.]